MKPIGWAHFWKHSRRSGGGGFKGTGSLQIVEFVFALLISSGFASANDMTDRGTTASFELVGRNSIKLVIENRGEDRVRMRCSVHWKESGDAFVRKGANFSGIEEAIPGTAGRIRGLGRSARLGGIVDAYWLCYGGSKEADDSNIVPIECDIPTRDIIDLIPIDRRREKKRVVNCVVHFQIVFVRRGEKIAASAELEAPVTVRFVD